MIDKFYGQSPIYRARLLAKHFGYKIKFNTINGMFTLTTPEEGTQDLTPEEAAGLLDRKLTKELRRRNGLE